MVINKNSKYTVAGFSVGCLGLLLVAVLQLVFLAVAIYCGVQAYDAFFVSDAIGVGIAWSIYPVIYLLGIINGGR